MIAFAAIALAAVLPASASAVTAKPADSFVESIGVNIHIGDPETPYVEHLPQVEQRLSELGARHVRTVFYPSTPSEYQVIHQLAAAGIKTTAILGEPTEPSYALGEMLTALKTPELAGAVDAVEGWNEPYVNTEATKTKVIENQRHIYEGVKDDPALSSLTVLGPSIIRNENHLVGDISAYLDDGNMHSYPEGEPPEFQIEQFIKRAAENSGVKLLFATESGYTNATNWTPPNKGENRPVPESVSATYIPRLFFEYWTRHIVRTFAYELLDDHADPGLTEREDHFGLLRNDLTPKPAFAALHDTITLLADPGPAFTPGALTYTLADSGTHTLHSTLLEKRDGSFYLALWRLESVWEPAGKKAIAAPPEPVKIEVPAGLASSAVYEPTVSATPIATGGAAKSVSVQVGAGVTLVKLVPATKSPTEAPATEAPATAAVPTAAAETTVLSPPFMPPVTVPTKAAAASRCLVPKLKGRRLASARRALHGAGCELGAVTKPATEATPSAPAGAATVVAQRPRAGTTATASAKVAVTLSR
jgi:hypothetical protein